MRFQEERLRDCPRKLAEVFTDINNLSLSQVTVPVCLKSDIIIPVPKKINTSCLNDYRQVAFTPSVGVTTSTPTEQIDPQRTPSPRLSTLH